MKWNCHIPGKPNTDWEGGYFPLTMEFSEEYPAKPPKVLYISTKVKICLKKDDRKARNAAACYLVYFFII